MKHLLITLIVLTGICINTEGQEIQDSGRVIFPAGKELYLENRDTFTDRFTPTNSEIDSADIYLEMYLKDKHLQKHNVIELRAYFRQYAGLIKEGQKVIFVNASCRKPDYFFENTYYPKVGGKCYFRAYVNLICKQVEGFYLNAPK